jgi:hypothetical protein
MYWVSIQATLFIVIVHYSGRSRGWRVGARLGGLRGCVRTCAMTPTSSNTSCPILWTNSRTVDWSSTSGTPTQMVQRPTSRTRSTLFSLFGVRDHTGASEVMWETCAPGHGEGPWNDTGAVTKRLPRRLELARQNCVRATPFDALMEHESQR